MEKSLCEGSLTIPKWLILANPYDGVTCRFVPWGQLGGETWGSQQWLWCQSVTTLCAGGHKVMVGEHDH